MSGQHGKIRHLWTFDGGDTLPGNDLLAAKAGNNLGLAFSTVEFVAYVIPMEN